MNGHARIGLDDPYYGQRYLYCQPLDELLFTENDTNFLRLYGAQNSSPYVKDGSHAYVVNGRRDAVNPARRGTKAAALYRLTVPAGQSARVRLRLTDQLRAKHSDPFARDFDRLFALRREETDEFYSSIIPETLSADAKNIMRQALAGLFMK
jgi:hypothetical protein